MIPLQQSPLFLARFVTFRQIWSKNDDNDACYQCIDKTKNYSSVIVRLQRFSTVTEAKKNEKWKDLKISTLCDLKEVLIDEENCIKITVTESPNGINFQRFVELSAGKEGYEKAVHDILLGLSKLFQNLHAQNCDLSSLPLDDIFISTKESNAVKVRRLLLCNFDPSRRYPTFDAFPAFVELANVAFFAFKQKCLLEASDFANDIQDLQPIQQQFLKNLLRRDNNYEAVDRLIQEMYNGNAVTAFQKLKITEESTPISTTKDVLVTSNTNKINEIQWSSMQFCRGEKMPDWLAAYMKVADVHSDSQFLLAQKELAEQNGPVIPRGRRRRRHRTTFTKEQLEKLNHVFENCTHYPDMRIRDELSASTGLTEETIHKWFQNQRAKDRKNARYEVAKELKDENENAHVVSSERVASPAKDAQPKITEEGAPSIATEDVLVSSTMNKTIKAQDKVDPFFPGFIDSVTQTLQTIVKTFGPRRNISVYTKEQLEKLEELFAQTRFPTVYEIKILAASSGLAEAQIRFWLENRRAQFCNDAETGNKKEDSQQLCSELQGHVEKSTKTDASEPKNVEQKITEESSPLKADDVLVVSSEDKVIEAAQVNPENQNLAAASKNFCPKFTPEQHYKLEEFFAKTKYPHIYERHEIGVSLGLEKSRVKVWFKNRRKQWRQEAEVGAKIANEREDLLLLTSQQQQECPKCCPKSKKVQQTITEEQNQRLQEIFRQQQFLLASTKEKLRAEIGLDEETIEMWFENRRNQLVEYAQMCNAKIDAQIEKLLSKDDQIEQQLTDKQIQKLKDAFRQQQCITPYQKKILSLEIELDEDTIEMWFENRCNQLKFNNAVIDDKTDFFADASDICIKENISKTEISETVNNQTKNMVSIGIQTQKHQPKPWIPLSKEQCDILEKEFICNCFLSDYRKIVLAGEIGAPGYMIMKWYKNRRAQERKQRVMQMNNSKNADKTSKCIFTTKNYGKKGLIIKVFQNSIIRCEMHEKVVVFNEKNVEIFRNSGLKNFVEVEALLKIVQEVREMAKTTNSSFPDKKYLMTFDE